MPKKDSKKIFCRQCHRLKKRLAWLNDESRKSTEALEEFTKSIEEIGERAKTRREVVVTIDHAKIQKHVENFMLEYLNSLATMEGKENQTERAGDLAQERENIPEEEGNVIAAIEKERYRMNAVFESVNNCVEGTRKLLTSMRVIKSGRKWHVDRKSIVLKRDGPERGATKDG